MDVIDYPPWDISWTMLVQGATGMSHNQNSATEIDRRLIVEIQ